MLEQAVCFGKILLVSRPVLSHSYKLLESKIIKSCQAELLKRQETKRLIEEKKDDFERQNDLLHRRDGDTISEQQVLMDCLKENIEEEFVKLSEIIFNQEWFDPKHE